MLNESQAVDAVETAGATVAGAQCSPTAMWRPVSARLGAFPRLRVQDAVRGAASGVSPVQAPGLRLGPNQFGTDQLGTDQLGTGQPGAVTLASPAGAIADSIQAASVRHSNDHMTINEKTRVYPVVLGGVGPHPAREPDPV